MADPRDLPTNLGPRMILRRRDQLVAGSILVVALVLMGLHWWYQAAFHRGLIDIDRAEPREIRFAVDINQADWPELALLPNIGEQLARRIVEHRAEHGRFRDLDQLKDVRGIGPKTFESVKHYLVPLPDVEATAGEAGVDESKARSVN